MTMTQTELVAKLKEYLGKSVCVESLYEGRNLGGEGYITDVLIEHGEVWVLMDWGFSWIVRDEQLKITEVPSDSPPLVVTCVEVIP